MPTPTVPVGPTGSQAAHADPAAVAAVALGGALGAVARYAIAEALPRQEPMTGTALEAVTGTVWPWATFATNLIGCLLLGLIVHRMLVHPAVTGRPRVALLARPFLVAGVLGGFTTFSALGIEAIDLVNAGRAPLAVAYIATSVVLGVLAVAGSGALARRWAEAR